jgi:rare lipoprotein A
MAPVEEPPAPAALPTFNPATIAPAVEAAAVKVVPPPPMPAPEISAAPSASTIAPAEAKGIFLQFGAFGSQKNADSYLGRLQSQVDATLATTLQVFPKGGLYRVQAGPYESHDAARQAAERINQTLGTKPLIVTR